MYNLTFGGVNDLYRHVRLNVTYNVRRRPSRMQLALWVPETERLLFYKNVVMT